MVGERTEEGFAALTLESGALGGIEAIFVPEAGMIGCSLRHRGEELLGQRGGLAEYVASGSTMGIPFLHPWANRLGKARFEAAGREVNLELEGLPLKHDAAGLPMHGLLTAAPGWQVERHLETDDGGLLRARFDVGSYPHLLDAFPFPHRVGIEATLAGAALTISTTITATGDAPVPIAFGFHPYLRLPGVPRAEWRLEAPVAERLALDERMLPTGRREAIRIEPGRLGARTFDDAYRAPPPGQSFALSGGGRRLELRMDAGYPFIQIYAPAGTEAVAIEPMTAPTNALVEGGEELPLLAPGDSFAASFSIRVAKERLVPESPPASSAAVRSVMQGNRSSGTKPEVAVASAIHRRGLRYRKHANPEPGLRCKADFVFRKARVAVFVDGCFWHGCPEHGRVPRDPTGYWAAKLRRNFERDRRNDEALAAQGWTVLRFWEHDDPEAVAGAVEERVRRGAA